MRSLKPFDISIEACNSRQITKTNGSGEIRSGVEKLTRSSLKGLSNRWPFLLIKMGVLQAVSLLGTGYLEASKKANLPFKSPSPKPHLDRTGSVFALPIHCGFPCGILLNTEGSLNLFVEGQSPATRGEDLQAGIPEMNSWLPSATSFCALPVTTLPSLHSCLQQARSMLTDSDRTRCSSEIIKSVKVRRGRQEGDGTENVMTLVAQIARCNAMRNAIRIACPQIASDMQKFFLCFFRQRCENTLA